jgi:benzoyl-CoA reductase subunit C
MEIDFKKILEEKHDRARSHKASGGLVMGCYPGLIPEEILWACGVLPVQLLMGPGTYGKAQAHLPPYVCDCSKSILEQKLAGSYDYLDGLLVSHVCETIRGLAGIWSLRWPDKFVHVFTPPVENDPGAGTYLRAEFKRLAERFSQLGAKALTEEGLSEAITLYNANRALVKQIYDIRGNHPFAVRPEWVLGALLAGMVMPKPLHNEMLREFIRRLEASPPSSESKSRVLLSGLTFENDVLGENGLFSILAGADAVVVWDDLASGMRYRLKAVREDGEGSPSERLVESFLGPQPAPTRGPMERRAREMLAAAHKYRVQGIIFLVPKYCDPILFDIPDLTRWLDAQGLPSLVLEMSGALTGGQDRTRIEAFLEVISDIDI